MAAYHSMKPGDGMKDEAGNPISPAEGWRRWFESYNAFLMHYARLSELCGADMLAIGNEFMTATTHEQEWHGMIVRIRRAYQGQLTYQAHGGTPYFEGEFKSIQFWNVSISSPRTAIGS